MRAMLQRPCAGHGGRAHLSAVGVIGHDRHPFITSFALLSATQLLVYVDYGRVLTAVCGM
jgi:hypothetical protein